MYSADYYFKTSTRSELNKYSINRIPKKQYCDKILKIVAKKRKKKEKK